MVENLFAAAGNAGGGAGGGNFLVSMLPLILIVVIMYFLILRPQAKKQKDRQRMLDAIKKGDEVVTVGGVHGKVMGFKNDEKVLVIKVDDNVKLDVDRTAISGISRSSS